jgi:hypothetical protein
MPKWWTDIKSQTKDDTLKKHLPEKMVRFERMDMILNVYKPK